MELDDLRKDGVESTIKRSDIAGSIFILFTSKSSSIGKQPVTSHFTSIFN